VSPTIQDILLNYFTEKTAAVISNTEDGGRRRELLDLQRMHVHQSGDCEVSRRILCFGQVKIIFL
jgi:hypothetical protein